MTTLVICHFGKSSDWFGKSLLLSELERSTLYLALATLYLHETVFARGERELSTILDSEADLIPETRGYIL